MRPSLAELVFARPALANAKGPAADLGPVLLAADGPDILRWRLGPGQGYISNNVLHNRSAFDDAPVACLHARHFLGVVRVEHEQDMEIAVADMTDDRALEAGGPGVLLYGDLNRKVIGS